MITLVWEFLSIRFISDLQSAAVAIGNLFILNLFNSSPAIPGATGRESRSLPVQLSPLFAGGSRLPIEKPRRIPEIFAGKL